MSTVSPLRGSLPTTIFQLANEVVIRLENRLNMLPRAFTWVKDALVEITSNTDLRDDFDELEVWGSKYVLPIQTSNATPQDTEVPFNNLLPMLFDPITGAQLITVNMATLDILLWINPPGNTKTIQLGTTHYQEADRGVSTTVGQPAEWYRFGDAIGFNPSPNKAYQVQARILREHPINDAALQNTVVLLNRSWCDVVEWAAVERGYIELQEFDKAAAIHTLLHGDPKYPMKIGLMQGAKKRRKKEAFRKSGAMRPVMRAYGWGR